MLPFELTKDTPYLALSGELWSVFYEYFNRNWPCYKGFLLYHACRGLGDLRSQGISNHGIDQRRWNIPSLATNELTNWGLDDMAAI